MQTTHQTDGIATESDIDVLVKRFGDRLDEGIVGTDFENELRELFGKFWDPTEDNPMDTATLLFSLISPQLSDYSKRSTRGFPELKGRLKPA